MRLFQRPNNLQRIDSRAQSGAGVAPWVGVSAAFLAFGAAGPTGLAGEPAGVSFGEQIQPILEEYCYGCHGNGSQKGNVKLDEMVDSDPRLRDRKLWSTVLRNVRAEIMPPAG